MGPRCPATDFTATTGTLSFAPGQTVKNIVVPISNDTAAEVAERFTVTLSTPVNATIADGTGTVVIGANDAAAVVAPGISLGADTVAGEADGYLDVPITLSAPSSTAVSVVYSFANMTAVNGVDYTCTTQSCFGTLIFAPGQTSPNDPGGDPQRRRRRTPGIVQRAACPHPPAAPSPAASTI